MATQTTTEPTQTFAAKDDPSSSVHKEEDPQGMHLIQRGLVAQGFHITPQEVEMEVEMEMEEEVVEVEGEDHLQLQEEETRMIEAMARS